jgi:hypothetical protein
MHGLSAGYNPFYKDSIMNWVGSSQKNYEVYLKEWTQRLALFRHIFYGKERSIKK